MYSQNHAFRLGVSRAAVICLAICHTASAFDASSFQTPVSYPAASGQVGLSFGDLDGDGKQDAVVANFHNSSVSVYRNTSVSGVISGSSFAPKVDFSVGSVPVLVRVADIDGDGLLDIVSVNQGNNSISVLRNTTTAGIINSNSFAPQITLTTAADPRWLAIGDFSGDGKLDLALACYSSGVLALFQNNSANGSVAFASAVQLNSTSPSASVESSDVDGDGKLDLVLAKIDQERISIFHNTHTNGSLSASSFAAPIEFAVGAGPTITIGDLDGDGKPDVVVPNQFANTLSVLRNTSLASTINSNSFAARVDFAAASYPYSAVVADLDGDGKADIGVANSQSHNVSVFRNLSTPGVISNSSLAAKIDYPTGTGPRVLAAVDVDEDGSLDLATANFSQSSFSVLRNRIGTVPPTNPPAGDFDAGRDFSATNNPAGVWSYGWKGTLGGGYSHLTVKHTATLNNGVVAPAWFFASGVAPGVYCNTSNLTGVFEGGAAQIEPGTIWYYPGPNNGSQHYAVVRFTAPSNGNYQVAVGARPVYNGPPQGDTDFHVLINSAEVFGRFLAAGQSTGFTGVVAMAANDVMDLALGRGADNNDYGSALKIAAVLAPTTNAPTVTTNPPPPVVHQNFDAGRDFSAANNPTGVWGYGWKSSLGGSYSHLTVKHTATLNNGVVAPAWFFASGIPPAVYCNTSNVTGVFEGGAAQVEPGTIWCYPGPNNNSHHYSVVRFTAPSNGNYEVTAAARPVYNGAPQGDTDFHVLINSAEVFGRFLAAGQSAGFTGVVAMVANDVMDFALGRGADNNDYGSALKIAAVVAPTTNAPTVTTNPPSVEPILISLWHADGNAEDAVGTNDGVLVNNVTFVPGVVGQAFQFDGSSHVRIADSQSLRRTNEFTVQMWFKRDANLPFGTSFTLFDKRDFTRFNYGANMSENYGVQLYYNDPNHSGLEAVTAPLVTATVWHHFAGTYRQLTNGVELTMYIDGVPAGTNVLPGSLSLAANNAPLAIGTARDGASDYFRGLIDEVALFNRALAPSEVYSNYVATAPTNSIPSPAIIAWWPFEGNGSDISGRNHAMTLNGTPAFATGFSNQAIVLDGVDDYGFAAANPELDLGANDGMTIEGWIAPAEVSSVQPILEWTDNSSVVGLHLWLSVSSPWAGGGPGSLFANVVERNGTPHHVSSPPGVIVGNAFQHVAMTYSKFSGLAKLYANGQLIASTNIGSVVPETRTAIYTGWRPLGGGQYRFSGKIDELRLHNHELSAAEIASINGTNAPSPPVLPPAIVSLWRGENNAQDSVGTNHGSLMHDVGFAPGVSGQAFRLNGSSYIRIPDSPSLRVTDQLTWLMWFKRDANLPWGTAFTLMDKRDLTRCSYGANMSHDYGLTLYYNDPAYYNFESLLTPLVSAGVWHHFAGTYRQKSNVVELTVYVDGSVVASNTLPGTLAAAVNNAAVSLGSARDGASDFFKGSIDEIAFYNYALSAAQIHSNFSSVIPPIETNTPPSNVSSNFVLGRDFSAVSNPSGPWGYGWKATSTGPFNPLTQQWAATADNGVTVHGWLLPSFGQPAVYGNDSTNTAVGGGGQATLPPGSVWVHPGVDGRPENFGAIRFTAPSNGNYQVAATVDALYSGSLSGDTDFHIAHGSNELFEQFLAPRTGTGYSNVLALNIGETVDFVVGRGADENQYGSALRLAIVITPTTNAPPTNPPAGPVIVTQPIAFRSVNVGDSTFFSISATGEPPLTFQWLFNGIAIAGATSATLTLSNVQPADAGTYRVIVSNSVNSVTSDAATLNVNENGGSGGTLIFANSQTNLIFDVGGTNPVSPGGSLTVGLFAGSTAEALQQVGGVASFVLLGQFYGGSRVVTNVPEGQVAYVRVKVWDSTFGSTYETAVAAGSRNGASPIFQVALGGGITPPPSLEAMPSFALTLPAVPPPQITSQPSSQGILLGQNAALTVSASGSGLTYQWFRNNAVQSGATTSTLAVSHAQKSDAGEYFVVISNSGGAVTSQVATLTVNVARTLAVVSPADSSEGALVTVPIVLESDGSVGGMTFVLHYNGDLLSAPEVVWDPSVSNGVQQANVPVPGQAIGVFVLNAGTVPAGTQTLAVVNFHARTVLSNSTSELLLDVVDVADANGDPIEFGTDVRNGTAAVTAGPVVVGDNNGNGVLDVGDVTLLLRLLAQIDSTRPWDLPRNDLNTNSALDSGDAIRILRAAATIESPAEGAKSVTKDALLPNAEVALLTPTFARGSNGLITYQVHLHNVRGPISGAAFTLNYPPAALRVADPQAHNIGPIIPAGSATVWNVSPTNNYAQQNGHVRLVASSAIAWPSSTGILAQITFQVQPGVSNQFAWPVTLSRVEVTALGYNRPLVGGSALLIGRNPRPGLIGGHRRLANGLFQFSVDGDAQAPFAIDASTDLVNWTTITNIVNATGTLQFSDPDAAGLPQRFYRARTFNP